MKTNQSFSKQAMILVLARAISFLVTMGIPLILVRFLTQSEFGAYKQTILLYTTAITLLPWGMAQSLYYFIPQNPKERASYLGNSFLFLIFVGSLSLVGFIFLGPYLEQYFHSIELANNSFMIGLFIFFTMASMHWEIVLISENRVSDAAFVILFSEIIKAITLIGGALILSSFTGIISAMAVAAAIRFVLLGLYFSQELKVILHGLNLVVFRKQWQYSMPFGLMILVTFTQDYFHQYYISYSLSPSDFAIYSIGCLQLPLIDLFYSSIGDVAMVKMTENLQTNNVAGLHRIWHDAIIKLNLIFLPLMIYVLVVSSAFITALFTINYKASVPIFVVSTVSLLFQGLLVDPVMRVFGQTSSMLLITVLRMPITIILVIIGLNSFGMVGVAASSIITLILLRTMMLVQIRKIMQIKTKDLLPWRQIGRILLVAIIAALPTTIAANLPFTSKSLLLITAPIYGLTFLIVGLKLNIFPLEEREMVKEAFNQVILRFSLFLHKSFLKAAKLL